VDGLRRQGHRGRPPGKDGGSRSRSGNRETLKVFITGASSGIGEALATLYAGRGATLGLVARRGEALERLRGALNSPVEPYASDVRDARAMRAAAEHFMGRHGVPDIVIGNAGVSHGTLTEVADDLAVFRETLDINVLGLVHTFHPFVAPMRAERRGALVGIASVAGYRGIPGASAYSASKAAAIRYLEALRVELRGSGVRVLTICPGFIDTPMTKRNPYPMPFLLDAGEAARRFARVIDSSATFALVPWQMAIVARLLSLLPNALYDRLLEGRAHKPRKSA
jgi:short-subunit dehydrogenase